MRIFVIWDLVAPAVRTLVEALPELLPRRVGADGEGAEIEWLIPGVTRTGKEMARDVIAAGLRESEHVIALLDRPSMSVGWQIGLALGFGRSLQLASIGGALPSWTQVGALKGLFTHHLNDVNGMAQLLSPLRWQLPAIPPSQLPDEPPSTLVLCPGGPIGSTLREVALRESGMRALPEEGWGLYELPRLLSGLHKVIWVLASDGKEQAPELADNASNGVIAGLAEASGLAVAVLRADDIAAVIDVQPREHRFRSLAEFKQKLHVAVAPADVSVPPARPVPSIVSSIPLPAALPPEPSVKQRRRAFFGLLILMGVAALSMGLILRGRTVWQPVRNAVPGPAPSFTPPPAAAPPPAAVPDLGTPAATAKSPAVKSEKHGGSRSRRSNVDPYAFMSSVMQLAANPGAMDPNLQPPPPTATAPTRPPRVKSAGGCEMGDDELKQLISDAKRETFQQQWAVLADGTQARCLTMKQLRTILKSFPLGADRVRIMRWIGPRILDPQKAYQLEDMLTYRDEISACQQLFGCCKSSCANSAQP